MHTRSRLIPLLGLAAGLVLTAVCRAQNPPSPLGTGVLTAVALSPEQVAQVNAYVKFYADLLTAESSTPSEIERARDGLVYVFVQPTARTMTPNFRGTYSNAAVPALRDAIKSSDIHRASNAAVVLAQLGTDNASNVLTESADSLSEPRWQVRLRAADGERLLLMGDTLDARKVKMAARALADAAQRETNGLVLRNQLAGLVAADTPSLSAEDRTTIRTLQAEALASVAKKLASANDAVEDSKVVALAAMVVTFRDRLPTQFTQKEQKAIGAALGPALGGLLEWARANWDNARADKQLGDDVGILVAACEGLLQRIDPVLPSNRPPPASDMNGAWKAGDKPKFESGVKAWQNVLDKAPYTP